MENSKIINTSSMDREIAILIYNNKIYEDSNHQYALEMAFKENNIDFNYNLDFEIDKVADITFNMSKNSEIYTFSMFSDGIKNYLVSHFPHYVIKDGNNENECFNLINDYCIKNNYSLYTYNDFYSDLAYLI